MLRLKTLVLVAAGAIVTGCTTLPEPADHPVKNPTLSIIAKARCELKFAMIEELATFLVDPRPLDPTDPRNLKKQAVRQIGAEYLELLKGGPAARGVLERRVRTLEYEDIAALSKPQLQVLNRIARSAVGYTFKLTAQEINDNRVDLSFVLPFSGDSLALGFVGGNKLDRKNEGSITFTDSFFLLRRLNCAHLLHEETNFGKSDQQSDLSQVAATSAREVPVEEERLLYPMTGSIGLDAVMNSYVGAVMKLDPHLPDIDRSKPKKGGDQPAESARPQACTHTSESSPEELCYLTVPDFTNKLTFATTVSGEVNPTLTFTGPENRRGLQLKEAKLSAKPSRVDTHELTIIFKPGADKTSTDKPKEEVLAEFVDSTGSRFKVTRTSPKGSEKRQTAVTIVSGAGDSKERFQMEIGVFQSKLADKSKDGVRPGGKETAGAVTSPKQSRLFGQPSAGSVLEVLRLLRSRERFDELADDLERRR